MHSTFRPLASSGSVSDNWHVGTYPKPPTSRVVSDRSFLLSRHSRSMWFLVTVEAKDGQLIAEFIKKET